MVFSVIAPLWLSRNAVSAASRPVAMRTRDWRGARQRRVDHPPLTVDERLGDGVEVHRLAARRVHRHQPRRHVHRTQQGDDQMRVVAADALAGEQRVGRPVDRIAASRARSCSREPTQDDTFSSRVARVGEITELGGREAEELVGLGVPAGPQIRRQVDVPRPVPGRPARRRWPSS